MRYNFPMLATVRRAPTMPDTDLVPVATYFIIGDSIAQGKHATSQTTDASIGSAHTKHKIYDNGNFRFLNYEAGVTGAADAGDFGPICRLGYDAGEYWVGKSGYNSDYVYTVEHAVGSTTLATHWLPGDPDSARLLEFKNHVRNAKSTAIINGESLDPKFIWISLGANDAVTEAHANAFAANAANLRDDLRSFFQSEFGIENIPIIWYRVFGEDDPAQVYYPTVRTAIDTFLDDFSNWPNTFLSDMDNAVLFDNVHPNADSTILQGIDAFKQGNPVPTSRIEYTDRAAANNVRFNLHGACEDGEENISHSVQVLEGGIPAGAPLVIVGNKLNQGIDLTLYLSDVSGWPGVDWSLEVTPTNLTTNDEGETVEFIGGASESAEYYVSANAGDDLNPGTLEKPFATIDQALSLLTAGETVYVFNGTYREFDLSPTNSGTSGNPITIIGQSRAGVIVDGSEVITGWTLYSGTTWQKAGWDYDSAAVWVNGSRLTLWGTNRTVYGASIPENTGDKDDMAAGSFLYESGTLYVRLSDDSDPNNAVVESSKASRVFDFQGKDYITLKRLTAQKTGDIAFSEVVRTNCDYNTIDDCLIKEGACAGINQSPTLTFGNPYGNTVRNCILEHNGIQGMNANNSDPNSGYTLWTNAPRMRLVFDNNIVRYNNYFNNNKDTHCGGIKFVPSSRDVEITNNTFIDNKGHQCWFDSPNGEILVQNNRVEVTDQSAYHGSGIMFEISDTGTPTTPYNFDFTIHNNLVIGISQRGIFNLNASNMDVRFNTLYNCNAGIRLQRDARVGYFVNDNRVEHNLVTWATHGSPTEFIETESNSDAEVSGNIIDNNYYHNGTGSTPVLKATPDFKVSSIYTSFAALFAAEGFEENGIIGDADFVDLTDYSAKASIRDDYGYEATPTAEYAAIYGLDGLAMDAVNPANEPDCVIYFIRSGYLGQTVTPGATVKDAYNHWVQNSNPNSVGIILEDGFIETSGSYWNKGNKALVDWSPNGAAFRNISLHSDLVYNKDISSNCILYGISMLSDENRVFGDAFYSTYQGSSGAGVVDVPGVLIVYGCDVVNGSDEVFDFGHSHAKARVSHTRIWGSDGSHRGALLDSQEHFTNPGETTETEFLMDRCLFYRNQYRQPLTRVEKFAMVDCVILDTAQRGLVADIRSSTFNPNPRSTASDMINCKMALRPALYIPSNYLTNNEKMLHCSAADVASTVYESNNKVYSWDGATETLLTSSPNDIITGLTGNWSLAGSPQSFYSDLTLTDTPYLDLVDELGAMMRFKQSYIRNSWDANTGNLVSTWADLDGFPTFGSSIRSYNPSGALTIQASGFTKLYDQMNGIQPLP